MLHDCRLVSLELDWNAGSIRVWLDRYESLENFIQARGIRKFSLSRLEEWGPSSCIDEVVGPILDGDKLQKLTIKMQSGDQIEITAESFSLPTA
jgi:hypothetical protein